MHHLPGQRIHRAKALPLSIVRHRTPPIGIAGIALRFLHFAQPVAKVEVVLPPVAQREIALNIPGQSGHRRAGIIADIGQLVARVVPELLAAYACQFHAQ
ncbi:hypothetical protein A7X75_16685 [Stenotrophomonas maltophilia]|nr:hypothetical protein A7X75_16685 [Stenotrophomonas maltophilia]